MEKIVVVFSITIGNIYIPAQTMETTSLIQRQAQMNTIATTAGP